MGSLRNHFEVFGIEQKTTFDTDFDIADVFGKDAVKDTFRRAFNEWKGDVEYLTELVLVLNWKCWVWHERNREMSELYGELWEKADNYAIDNLKGEELRYYLKTTD